MEISAIIHADDSCCEAGSRKRRVCFSEHVECRAVKARTVAPPTPAQEEDPAIEDGRWSPVANDHFELDSSDEDSDCSANARDELVAMKTRDGPTMKAVVTQMLVLKLYADRKIAKSTIRDILYQGASIMAGRAATDKQYTTLCAEVEQRLQHIVSNIQEFGRAPLMPSQRVLGSSMLGGMQFLLASVASVAMYLPQACTHAAVPAPRTAPCQLVAAA
mmetsp:Transcript_8998/g.26077  ORF Transcript_8998/g.26077 Transcript_8998/m.26077 type:complete len:218 (-) Transcript_8998:37-690(-)